MKEYDEKGIEHCYACGEDCKNGQLKQHRWGSIIVW